MMLDLPVLGYPKRPTESWRRCEWRALNWRRVVIRVPLPKEFVREAWKARVGCCLESKRTVAAYCGVVSLRG